MTELTAQLSCCDDDCCDSTSGCCWARVLWSAERAGGPPRRSRPGCA